MFEVIKVHYDNKNNISEHVWCYIYIFQRLFEIGARRVLVTGTGPLGCVPAELAQRSVNGECSAELQRAASLFNPQLVQIIRELNSEIGSDVFVAVNTQQMHVDFISNPQRYGKYATNYAYALMNHGVE